MARYSGRNEAKTAASALRALQLLDKCSAVQAADKPLITLMPLIADGYAEVVERFAELANGKTWHLERVAITPKGRVFLAQLSEAKQ